MLCTCLINASDSLGAALTESTLIESTLIGGALTESGFTGTALIGATLTESASTLWDSF